MKAIDLFAGMGGFTEGARLARVGVVWCGNHWRAACDMHLANHPHVTPVCQDLQQADWTTLPRHDIGLASPSCTGHSNARGVDQVRHDAARSTAWAVVSCAETHREKVWVVENVPQFLEWTLYPAWKMAMESLGYCVSPHLVDAADYGVAQHRPRVFIVCTRSKNPLVLKMKKLEHVPFESCVDLLSMGWSPVREKCLKTRQRVARGRKAFGNRFIFPYYSSGSGLTGRSMDRPIGTITTKDRWALVEGSQMRMLSVNECRSAMGFRESYILPKQVTLAKHMLGNAVCPPVAQRILQAIRALA